MAMQSRAQGLQSIQNSRMLLRSSFGWSCMSTSKLAVFFVSSLATGLVSQSAWASSQQPAQVPKEIVEDAKTQAPPRAQSGPAPTSPQGAPVTEAPPQQVTASAPLPPSERPEPTFVGGFGSSGGGTARLPEDSGLGIGLTLGYTSGLGLSLRRHFRSGFGIHVGGFGYWTSNDRHLNLATQLLYSFYRGRMGRIYALAGVAWHVNDDQRTVRAPALPGQDPNADRPVRYEDYFSHRLIFGPGVGGELFFHRRFGMSLEVPLAISIDQVGEKSETRFEDRLSIHPGINASMHFYF